MKVQIWKKLTIVGMASSILLTSCTDEEVATAIGIVGITAGAVAIGIAADRDHDRHDRNRRRRTVCRGGYRQVCHVTRDYWGNRRKECRERYDSCAYKDEIWGSLKKNSSLQLAAFKPGRPDLTEQKKYSFKDFKEVSELKVDSVAFGEVFEIGFDGADKFVSALEIARAGNKKALENLGLSQQDMKAIIQYQMPSADGVDQLSRELNQEKGSVVEMLKGLLQTAQQLSLENAQTL